MFLKNVLLTQGKTMLKTLTARDVYSNKVLKTSVVSLLLFFICALPFGILAQRERSFLNISTDDGLSHNTVLSINQDSLGRLWFGTYNGLNAYDGSQLRVFLHDVAQAENSIPDNQILHIEVDRDRQLWFGMSDGSISRLIDFEKAKFKTYSFSSSTKPAIDSDGNIYLISSQGNYRYDVQQDKFYISNEKIRAQASSMLETQFRTAYPHVSVLDFFQVSTNKAWLASKHNGIFLLTQTANGQLSVENIRHKKNKPFALNKNEAYAVFEDKEGILWVGTKDGGVNKLLPQAKFLNCLHADASTASLPPTSIRAVCRSTDNKIWVGTYEKGVSVYSSATQQYQSINHRHKPDMFNWDRIRSINQTHDGHMWIGSYGGLLRISPNGKRTYYPAGAKGKALSEGRIYSMFEDTKGYLWLGGWSGIDRVHIKSGKLEHVLSQELSDQHVRCLLVEGDSVVWIGTELGGIGRYSIQNKTIQQFKNKHEQENVLSSNSIFHILKASSGKYWISTANGITIYDAAFESFTTLNETLPSQLIYSVFEDKAGRFWVNSSQGVVVIGARAKTIRYFDHNDGWINTEMCEGACYQSPTGEIFFGGNKGVNFFMPNEMYTHFSPPKVRLTRLGTGLQNSFLSSKGKTTCLELHHFNKNIVLNIHAFHYLAPNKNKIAWRLLPNDTVWQIALGAKHQLRYNMLQAGNYQLQYKACSADGVWSEVSTCQIKIAPPFWQSNIFWLLVILVALMGTLILFRFKIKVQQKNTQRLERLISERTLKIEQQQRLLKTKNEELEQMNEELASSNEDISKQKTKIEKQHNDLLQLHNRLQEMNELKMQFFSNLAHEFRTPLTLIVGPIEQLLGAESQQPTPHTDKLIRIKKQSDILLKLVNQLLDFKRLESGHIQLDKKAAELVHFCSEVLGSFEYEAQQNSIQLLFQCELDNIHCLYDPDKLRQILVNLLSNATKFTPAGGCVSLGLAVDCEHQQILFTVKDTGIGIPSDQVEQVFERFFQVQGQQHPSKPGSGLGLAYVKELVQLHHGQIEVDSLTGEGSCFTIRIPYEACTSNALVSRSPKADKELPQPDNSASPCVLVVDDHPEMLEYIGSVLPSHYHVHTAPNGQVALKKLKTNKVDIILTDWLMPAMDGLSFCQKVKHNKQWRQIPVIMVSALSDQSSEIKAIESGADDFFSKPFSSELLLKKIANLLAREKALVETQRINQQLEPSYVKTENTDELLSQQLNKIIEKHIASPEFRPETLGEEMGWSKMQLYRKIKQVTGFTPNELIQSTRLKRGKQMLEDPNMRINEVGFAVGFNDPKYFSRCFAKAFGLTPTQFQEQQRAIAREIN